MTVRHFFSLFSKRLFPAAFFVFTAVFLPTAALLLISPSVEGGDTPLLSQMQLAPYGLIRSWFNQVDIDASRSKVEHAIFEGDTLFIVTNNAKLHAINAETGKTLWVRNLGRRDAFYQEPAANSRMVAVLNASELFVFDRRNGKMLMNVELAGASATACEISENYAYVPMMGGRMIVYPLLDRKAEMETEAAGRETAKQPALDMTEEVERNESPGKGAEDPVLESIRQRFAEAKAELFPENVPDPGEEPIVLQKAMGIPMVTQTFGNLSVKPKIASQVLVFTPKKLIRSHREILTWVIDRGYLLAASIDSLSQEKIELQYMVDSSAQNYFLRSDKIAQRDWNQDKAIVSRPTLNQCVPFLYTDNRPQSSEIPSIVVAGSKGAYVFAVKDRTGEVLWQFACNGPVTDRIAIVGTDVYCPTSTGGLHALDLLSGEEKWFTPAITRFVAASKKRLYTIDRRERLVVLNRETGNPESSFDVRKFDKILFNIETDRIYFITNSGLVQCLAERQPQSQADLQAAAPIPVVRHRLSCKQYLDVCFGKDGSPLYWMEGGDGEESETEGGERRETTRRRSGEDGSLDGDETDEAPAARRSGDGGSKKAATVDEDPFGE